METARDACIDDENDEDLAYLGSFLHSRGTTDAEELLEDIPSDAMAALESLRPTFPEVFADAHVPYFATRSQLRTIIRNQTALDRDLDHLRRLRKVLFFRLPLGPHQDHLAVVPMPDFLSCLAQCATRAQATHVDSFRNKTEHSTTDIENGSPRPGWPFLALVSMLRHSPSSASLMPSKALGVSVPRDTLVRGFSEYLARDHRDIDSSSSGEADPVRKRRKTSSGVKDGSGWHRVQAEIGVSQLEDSHVLIPDQADSGILQFGFPGVGVVVKVLNAGRKDFIKAVGRRKFRECLFSDLKKLKIPTLPPSAREWLCIHLHGAGIAQRMETTVGSAIRLLSLPE